MTRSIDIAEAKKQLVRINDILEQSLLLIGGLAVQQYYYARNTYDIDLVCDHPTERLIIRKLFPSRDWSVEDQHSDDYRPDVIITNKVSHIIIKWGPKIVERPPYEHIKWDDLKERSSPFHYQGDLPKILVP